MRRKAFEKLPILSASQLNVVNQLLRNGVEVVSPPDLLRLLFAFLDRVRLPELVEAIARNIWWFLLVVLWWFGCSSRTLPCVICTLPLRELHFAPMCRICTLPTDRQGVGVGSAPITLARTTLDEKQSGFLQALDVVDHGTTTEAGFFGYRVQAGETPAAKLVSVVSQHDQHQLGHRLDTAQVKRPLGRGYAHCARSGAG